MTVVHRGDQILAREDADVAAELQEILEAEGIRVVLNATTSASSPTTAARRRPSCTSCPRCGSATPGPGARTAAGRGWRGDTGRGAPR